MWLTRVKLLLSLFTDTSSMSSPCSGRLDKLLYVPLPTPDDRYAILKALSLKVRLGPDVDLKKIGHSPRAEGYSGADCAALLREAGLAVLKENMSTTAKPATSTSSTLAEKPLCITACHFQYAFDHVIPSVSRKDQARYNRMRDRMAHARSRGAVISEVKDEEDGMEETTNTATTTLSGIKSEDKDETTNTGMEQS